MDNFDDLSYLQDELNSIEANTDCGYTHEELWEKLFNQIQKQKDKHEHSRRKPKR
jgi:hypothetical protein